MGDEGAAIAHSPLVWILALVVVQRLGELALAWINTRRLIAQGGREIGRAHYPLFILLHTSWLIALALTTPVQAQPAWPLIGAVFALQILRLWVIATLGPYWTTRIITIDDTPLVRRGPFRFVRHPNYWIVSAEIAVLPLAFGAWEIALIWSILNAVLLRHRVAVEDDALAPREAFSSPPKPRAP